MATSASTLNDFIAHVKKQALPLGNKFQVIIGGSVSSGHSTPQSVSMLCDSTTIPGYNHMTNEIRRYGEVVEMPYGVTYPDVPMTFFVDNTNQAKEFFDTWSNQVFDKNTRGIGFYNDYVRNIDIYLENKQGDVIYHVKLFEAYPKLDGHFQVAYDNKDILRINVLIKYKWLAMGDFVPKASTNLSSGILSGWGSGLSSDFLTGGNIFGNEGANSFTGQFGGVVGSPISPGGGDIQSLSLVGDVFQSQIPRNAYGVASVVSDDSGFWPGSLSTNFTSLGNQFSTFGSNVNQIAVSPQTIVTTANSMASQATAISSIITSTAGQIAGIGGYVQGLNRSVTSISRAASQLGSASNPMQALGAIQTMGSGIGQLGGAFNMLSAQAVNITNMPAAFIGKVSALGNVTAQAGSNLTNTMNGFRL